MPVAADPARRLVWVSPALPGATHDLTAARSHGIVAALPAAEILTLAGKAYRSAGKTIRVPFHGRDLVPADKYVRTGQRWFSTPRRRSWFVPSRPPHASLLVTARGSRLVLLRLAYLGITNAFALLRLLPGSDRTKNAEILALRHQLGVLQRQLAGQRVRFDPADRAWLAALLHQLPKPSLQSLRLLVRPDTVLRWHRDLIARRHAVASRPRRRGRPPTVRSIRVLVLRVVADNPSWGYRRMHGELLTLGITVAASTVWEMLREAGIDPAPDRAATTWTQFLRTQADALLAADFLETVTLTGTRMYSSR
jgi:transposase